MEALVRAYARARRGRPAPSLPPLLAAISSSDVAAVATALANGADVNEVYADGRCALHVAACVGDVDVVRALLGHGADVAAVNRNGSTPLWLAAWYAPPVVMQVLIDGGSDVNARNGRGIPPLMAAAMWDGDAMGKVSLLLALPSLDVDVTYKDRTIDEFASEAASNPCSTAIAAEVWRAMPCVWCVRCVVRTGR